MNTATDIYSFGKQTFSYFAHDSRDDWMITHCGQSMRQRGVRTFIDHENIRAGDNYDEILKGALRTTNEIVVFLTPHSIESQWVGWEVNAGWLLDKPMLPIRYGIPLSMARNAFDGRFAHTNIISIEDVWN